MEAILTRRSIRKYTDEEIPDSVLKKLITAGCSAPSAGNQQPWQFIIIDQQEIMNKIPSFHPNAKMITKADKALLVCGDLKLEKMKGYWTLDCSAATQNILMAARAEKLGACWLGIYPREERISKMRELLDIPSHVVPFSLISLGYPDEESHEIDRYQESRVHYNQW